MANPRWRRFVSEAQESTSGGAISAAVSSSWPNAWSEALGYMEPLDVATYDPVSAGRDIQATRMRLRSIRTKWVVDRLTPVTGTPSATDVAFILCMLLRGSGQVNTDARFKALMGDVQIGNPAQWAKLLEGATLAGLAASGVEATLKVARHKVMPYSRYATQPFVCEVAHRDIYLNEGEWAGVAMIPYPDQAIQVSTGILAVVSARVTETRWRMESRATAMRR